MSEQVANPTQVAPPLHMQLIEMSTSYWISRMVYAAAKLGLGDLLAAGPKSAEELYQVTGSHQRSLHRFMRSLANFGILTHQQGDRFALTPLGECLRSDAPNSARGSILALAGPWMWSAYGEFEHSLKTGETCMKKAHGVPLFDYLAQHPQEATYFSQAMVGFHGGEPPTVAEAYDFSQFGTIVDVGGATGNMLMHILERYPTPQGILFDLPHVLEDAPAFLANHGLTERVALAQGNFFEKVPPGGDAYILSHIIHDWNEDQCLTILGNCRQVMKPTSKLLIVEFVLPEGDTPHLGKLADMVMLAIPGGEERTAKEYEQLLEKADLRVTQVVPTESPVSVVEAVLK